MYSLNFYIVIKAWCFLFVCSLFSDTQIMQVEWVNNVDQKGCDRKQLCHNLRYYPSVCLKDWAKQHRTSVAVVCVSWYLNLSHHDYTSQVLLPKAVSSVWCFWSQICSFVSSGPIHCMFHLMLNYFSSSTSHCVCVYYKVIIIHPQRNYLSCI